MAETAIREQVSNCGPTALVRFQDYADWLVVMVDDMASHVVAGQRGKLPDGLSRGRSPSSPNAQADIDPQQRERFDEWLIEGNGRRRRGGHQKKDHYTGRAIR